MMLSEEQYKVETSQSVADALAAVEQKSFDVYVVDYKLPDGSGLDVAERVRSKWGATPIILISGYDPSAVALRAEKLRISGSGAIPLKCMFLSGKWVSRLYAAKTADQSSRAVVIFSVRSLRSN